jgi:hypothetical protein
MFWVLSACAISEDRLSSKALAIFSAVSPSMFLSFSARMGLNVLVKARLGSVARAT